MTVAVQSFSYRHGLPECVDGFVFDCRGLPNPHDDPSLRELSGCDRPVQDFMAAHAEEVQAFLLAARALVQQAIRAGERTGRARLTVSFGCVGGRHRSVYCAEAFAEFLRACEDVDVELVHFRLERRGEEPACRSN